MSGQQLVEKPVEAQKPDSAPSQTKVGSRRPVAFFVALILFAGANLLLNAYSYVYQPGVENMLLEQGAENNGHTKPWTWWMARRYLQQTKAPEVVIFGSSQMGSATCAADAQHMFKVIDALVHRHAVTLEDDLAERVGKKVQVFNLASPGAMCSDALMASRALFLPRLTPKVVIIGLSPRDFIDNTMPYPAATEPFRFYSQFASPGPLLSSSYTDGMSWLQFGVDAMPFKKLGVYLNARVANSSDSGKAPSELDKQLANAASPMAAVLGGTAIPGKWNVPANIPATLWADNTREYKNRFRNPDVPVYACERRFFSQFLEDMQNRGVKVLVVGMPSLQMNRDLLTPKFWAEFRQNLATSCKQHDASFLDLSADPKFVKSDYLDTVHLNAWGGMKLFSSIADYAKGDPSIEKLLK